MAVQKETKAENYTEGKIYIEAWKHLLTAKKSGCWPFTTAEGGKSQEEGGEAAQLPVCSGLTQLTHRCLGSLQTGNALCRVFVEIQSSVRARVSRGEGACERRGVLFARSRCCQQSFADVLCPKAKSNRSLDVIASPALCVALRELSGCSRAAASAVQPAYMVDVYLLAESVCCSVQLYESQRHFYLRVKQAAAAEGLSLEADPLYETAAAVSPPVFPAAVSAVAAAAASRLAATTLEAAMEAFSSAAFQPGFIPEVPPPPHLCG
ncbi:nucleoporin FG repeat-containing protein [Cyclospora cayetanensis]|uniref:Nucleoporin FG repeat-containing protein n=1 Tax=Cyclospora cayetanensis TaxID=88456 RepID=A0A1D3CU39_9EIME|nr:nucleoporin FG repeat-containing protein [Cyclospora cayetanensis]